ncbi:MAG: molybdate ABC transporter permease subunit [Eubacteriales bacterium]
MNLSPLWISIKTATTATIITFFLGIAMAWWIAGYRGRLHGIIDSILTLPMVLPPTVVGFFLLLLFGKNSFIGGLLDVLGTQVIFTWSASVLAATVVSFPLMYKTARSSFEQIDENLMYAARTLGASHWKIFWEVAVPLAWSGIIAGAVLSFARSLGEFGATLMVAGSILGRTQTIPVAIYFASQSGNMDLAFKWVIIICVISLVVMNLMNFWNTLQSRKY